MQKYKKLSARILSMALSAAMMTTMLPAAVLAAEGDAAPDASSIGTIQSFDKLEDRFIPSVGKDAPDHVYALSVALNTPYEDLQLPTELTAMVARTAAAPAEDKDAMDSDKTDKPAADEGIPDEDKSVDEVPSTDDTVSGDQSASSDATVSGDQSASSSDTKEDVKEEIKDEDVPLAPEPERDEETTGAITKQESIPVRWNSDKDYKSDADGQFIYTAKISEDYILADGVKLPQIYVTVGKQQTACVDTAASNILLDKLLILLADQQTMINEGGSDVTATDEFKALAAEIDALYAHVDACEICAAQMTEGGAYYDKFYGTQTLDTSVCEINGTGYSSLQAALNNVEDGQTIKILADITGKGVKFDQVFFNNLNWSCTIDLNGFDLTLTGTSAQPNGLMVYSSSPADRGCHLTLTDSSNGEAGTLTATAVASDRSAAGILASELTISRITVVASAIGKSTYSCGIGVNSSWKVFTIKDGAAVTAQAEAATRSAKGVDISGKIVVDNATLYASSSADTFSYDNCATSVPPEDALGNKLNPNEDPTNPDGWKRLVATYGVTGPSITIGAQSAALPYGTAGTATYAVTGKDFDSTAFDPAVQWKSGESWGAAAPEGLTGALTGSGDSRTFTVTTTAAANAGEYEFKVVSGDVESTAKVKIDKAAYASQTQSFTVKSDTANAAATVTLPTIAGASYGTVTVSTNTDGLINGTPTVSGTTLTMNVTSKPEGKTAALSIPVTGATNYNDFTMTVNITAKNKDTVTITGLTAATGLVYTGSAQKGYTGTVAVQDSKVPVNELVYTYTSTDSGAYNSTTAPTKAGAYKLVVSVAESNEAYQGAHADLLFTIAKAEAKVGPGSYSMSTGGTLPKFELQYTGLVKGELITPSTAATFSCRKDGADVDGKTAGTYEVLWSNMDAVKFSGADNYTVTKEQKGFLSVTASSSGSGGGGGGGFSTSTSTLVSGGGSSLKAPSTAVTSKNVINNSVGSKGTTQPITDAVKNAVASGLTNTSTSVSFANYATLTVDGVKAINDAVAKAVEGKNVNLDLGVNFDQKAGNAVLSRISVNPVELAKVMTNTLKLGVSIDQKNAQVAQVNSHFAKYFTNKIVSIVYNEKKPLDVSAEIAAKLDLAKTFENTSRYYFYSYDNVTNAYTLITTPNYFVDANGYTHITAPFGGSVIITDAPLTGK